MTPTETASPDGALVERIRKLLRLAGNNPNEAEASVASLKAAELAMRAGLSLSHVIALDDGVANAGGAVIEEVETVNKYAPQWRLRLLHGLAEALHCKLVVVSSGFVTEKKNGKKTFNTETSRWQVIGTPANIVSVTELYRYLAKVMAHLAREAVPQAQADYDEARRTLSLPAAYYNWPDTWVKADLVKWLRKHPDGGQYVRDFQPQAFQTAFCDACGYRVTQRIAAREREIEANGLPISEHGPAVTALVVADQAKQWDADNQALYQKLFPPRPEDDLLQRKRGRRERDPLGLQAGAEAGETIGIDPQLKESDR